LVPKDDAMKAAPGDSLPRALSSRGAGSGDALRSAVERACNGLSAGQAVAVACSGGRDSIALLHVAAGIAAEVGGRVVALHVHHGLSVQADDWALHVQQACESHTVAGRPVSFQCDRIDLRLQSGQSLEAEARRARYAALARMAHAAGVDRVLLAHHLDDQAETFLLQALRGAGAAGLAAMPDRIVREGLLWIRPWLSQPRSVIEAHVRVHGLKFIEDDSNCDPRYARNRLRLAVMPALREAFGQAPARLAVAAQRAQDARQCLEDLAVLDLAQACAGSASSVMLQVPALRVLSPARRRNLLLYWLRGQLATAVPATLVDRLADELPHVEAGQWPVPGGTAVLRVYRQQLRCEPLSVPVNDAAAAVVRCRLVPGPQRVAAWLGVLWVEPVARAGVEMWTLQDVELRPRTGGERFQCRPGGVARAIKKQFQAQAVPAWARGGPLVHAQGQVLFVPGLGMDARHWAPEGRPAWALRWVPDGSHGPGAQREVG
jgi:tRNA(Ile)-lysidine synthase